MAYPTCRSNAWRIYETCEETATNDREKLFDYLVKQKVAQLPASEYARMWYLADLGRCEDTLQRTRKACAAMHEQCMAEAARRVQTFDGVCELRYFVSPPLGPAAPATAPPVGIPAGYYRCQDCELQKHVHTSCVSVNVGGVSVEPCLCLELAPGQSPYTPPPMAPLPDVPPPVPPGA
jgi:hypothetical protein